MGTHPLTQPCVRIVPSFLQLLGLAAVGIGIWVLVEGNDYDYFLDGAVVIGGTILIIAGVVTIVISAVGILGAIFKLRLLLVIVSINESGMMHV